MSTPGSNLLRQARRSIRFEEVVFFKFAGREQNEARQWVNRYKDPIGIMASVQAIPRENYALFGLEFQKNYITIFAELDIIDIQRDSSGDKMIYGGVNFQMESKTGWYLQDGWASCIAVGVGAVDDRQPTY